MTNPLFKKSLIVSAIWHLATFGIFGLSFGPRMMPVAGPNVSFWSSFLGAAQFKGPYYAIPSGKPLFGRPVGLITKSTEGPEAHSFDNYYLKPRTRAPFIMEKQLYAKGLMQLTLPKKIEPQIVFHPSLPYDFAIYFKDRQVVHVELMYMIVPQSGRKPILLQRKVSSGSLEADLLIMRYIGHYLFMQQAWIPADKWQTVKIDLSAKND